MNKIAKDRFAAIAAPQFTDTEVAQLRALMKVARYDDQERAFVFQAGDRGLRCAKMAPCGSTAARLFKSANPPSC